MGITGALIAEAALHRCGGRSVHLVPLWPDVRQKRAVSLSVDVRPAMPGTVPGFRTLEAGEISS